MDVEIINTSPRPLLDDLMEALTAYAPYHNFGETRNRIVIETELYSYDIRCAFVEVDETHIVIWISDWYRKYRDE